MEKIKSFLKEFFDEKFWRYCMFGFINTAVGASVMFFLYNFLLHPYEWGYWVSSAANHITGGITSYILNKRFTFKNREKGPGALIRFALVMGISYVIGYSVAKPLAAHFLADVAFLSDKMKSNIALFCGMCLFTAFNYTGQRFFTFKKREEKTEESDIGKIEA